METKDIKYSIPKLLFDVPPASNQVYKLEVKETTQEDSAYRVVKDSFIVGIDGVPLSPVTITSLNENTAYTARLTNALTNAVFTMDFHTHKNMSLADDSPILGKVLFSGQAVNTFPSGLLSIGTPGVHGGFFYDLQSNFRDTGELWFANIVNTDTKWKTVTQTEGEQSVAYTGFEFGEGRYLVLNNNDDTVEERRVNGSVLFGASGAEGFSFFFWMLVTDDTDKPVATIQNADEHFKIYIENKYLILSSKIKDDSGTVTTTVYKSVYEVTVNKWYCVEFTIRSTENSNCFMYGQLGTGNTFIAPQGNEIKVAGRVMKGKTTDKLYIGYDDVTRQSATGLIIHRLYWSKVPILDNGETRDDKYKITAPKNYIPHAVVKYPANYSDTALAGTDAMEIPEEWQSKLDDSQFTFVLPPTFPNEGMFNVFARVNGSDVLLLEEIQIKKFKAETTGFDINFNDGDFNTRLNEFKQHFYAFHSQWGGANGGCSGHLIYGNPQNNSLIFECHGDNYSGTFQGVAKDKPSPTYKGYGIPKTHEIPDDPKVGEPWVTRVGSVALSAGYHGYGEWSTWLKIPRGAYGVCFALWFFHYQELYSNDSRWDYWVNRGIVPYGGESPYLVVNSEIDLELPSHIIMGTFATWAELSTAYFDTTALDTDYRVAVESDTDASKNGLFRLTDIEHPNLFASWVKESDSWSAKNKPSFAACKFNNWHGEHGSGNGWAYTEADYAGEEYVAKLTKLTQDYADDEFHKWTMKWYKDRTELWIDDVKVRVNKSFVPYIAGRMTLGAWFPSGVNTDKSETPWLYDTANAWAGYPADFEVLHFEVQRISFTPYSEAEAGGVCEEFAETFPESGLRNYV